MKTQIKLCAAALALVAATSVFAAVGAGGAPTISARSAHIVSGYTGFTR